MLHDDVVDGACESGEESRDMTGILRNVQGFMSPNKMCGQVRWSGGGAGELFIKASLGQIFQMIFFKSRNKCLIIKNIYIVNQQNSP